MGARTRRFGEVDVEPVEEMLDQRTKRSKAKKYREFFNYFGEERRFHQWLADRRTRLTAAVFPPFDRLGMVPDTLSYVGICLLVGVIIYYVRNPFSAACFLLGHILCDGLDGAFARNSGKASQSGAFTDLICDQLGMVVVAIMAVFHHFVTPLIGAVYVVLYLIVVVFGVLMNVIGPGSRITATSKYFLYCVYGVWAFWGVNWFPELMSFFSVVMTIEVIVGYFRLKRGIRKKYDSEIRFSKGDPYSGKLNYALNVAVPATVLLVILVTANIVPIRAMLDTPKQKVKWQAGPLVEAKESGEEILGIGAWELNLLYLVRDASGHLRVKELASGSASSGRSFALPGYIQPASSTLAVDDGVLLVADGRTRLVMGMDLNASFAAGKSVTTMSLPLGHLRITALATAWLDNRKVWVAANYLYTRKTYIVDPVRASEAGTLLGGVESSYVNGAFPSGAAVLDGHVIELNRSPFGALLYVASFVRMIGGTDLIRASRISFLPPHPRAIGPVILGDDLAMISPEGRVFTLPIAAFLPKQATPGT